MFFSAPPGSWSQRSIASSLQRAESLLRSTFNPSLKWLFHCRGQDEEEDEGHFVVAHNLVSRSSARLLRLQQALLTVAPQWQQVSWAQRGSPQVSSGEGSWMSAGVINACDPLNLMIERNKEEHFISLLHAFIMLSDTLQPV